MMIEERFSHVLRNIPRMKFQSVTFEERKRDCNKNTYEVKRIDRRDIEQAVNLQRSTTKNIGDQKRFKRWFWILYRTRRNDCSGMCFNI